MRVAVYCSSKENVPHHYVQAAQVLGRWIGGSGATLVYGGISKGLMKEVASATKAEGGKVVGIVPVTRQKYASTLNDINIIADDLNDRKAKLIAISDVYVVLPGGYGTLDELISTFTFLSFIGNDTKKVLVVNLDGLFDPTISQLQLMVKRGLMDLRLMNNLKVVATADECCQHLESYKTKSDSVLR